MGRERQGWTPPAREIPAPLSQLELPYAVYHTPLSPRRKVSIFVLAELQFVQVAVTLTLDQQIAGVALLDDPPIFQYQSQVRVERRLQVVSYQKARLVGHQ